MEEISSSRFAKNGTHDSLSCVDLPCSDKRAITTPPGHVIDTMATSYTQLIPCHQVHAMETSSCQVEKTSS